MLKGGVYLSRECHYLHQISFDLAGQKDYAFFRFMKGR